MEVGRQVRERGRLASEAGEAASEIGACDAGAVEGVDDLLRRFVVQGYVVLPPSAPSGVHASVAQRILGCGVQAAGGRVPYGLAALDGDAAGNNLLHAAPELRGAALLESPHLVAALRALLGEGYRLHPHCRGHLRQRGSRTTM